MPARFGAASLSSTTAGSFITTFSRRSKRSRSASSIRQPGCMPRTSMPIISQIFMPARRMRMLSGASFSMMNMFSSADSNWRGSISAR